MENCRRTISKIKIYPDGSSDKVVVTFKESGFEDADYTVTVSSSDSSVNKDYPVTTVEVSGEAVNRGDFNNEYDRISGGLKVVKKVTVNGGDTTGTLADGEYTFRLLESDQITQAKDKNGELVEDFSITITNGVADPIEIDNLIPGDYYVLEINGTNKAVTLDYEPKQVKVVANKTGDDIDAETGIATITNNLPTTVVKADKKWVDGNDAELENWPENAKATFGVFAGNSTTPLVTVELDGTPTPEESVPADGDTPAVEGIPADGDTPAAYEANKEGKESGGGLAIFKNLPQKDKNGNTIVYTIKEIGEPEGFKNETPDGVANGGTITNKQQDQKGALKLKKIVLVNGATPASAQANLVNGAYDFSVTGPIVQEETPEQDDTPDDTSKVIKFIRIVVWNNQMAFYQGADTQEELSRSSSSGWTPFSGNDAERWVLVENLEEGDYLITELGSHQVSNMGSDVYGFVEDKPVVSVSLYDISGGKDEEPDLGNGTVTVHVTNGDATASNAEAQVSYTNNYWSANIDILKIDETTRDQETSTPLSGAKFRLLKWDDLVPAGTEVNYVSYNESYGAEAGVEVNAQGKLEFDGLSDGEYKIVETKTPDGYIKTEVNDIYFKLEKGVVIRHSTPSVRTVTGTDVRSIEWGTVIAERERVAQVTYTKAQVASDDPAKDAEFIVGNTPGAKLPSTGGPGTTMIYVLGSIMTLLAAVLLITKRRTDGQGID